VISSGFSNMAMDERCSLTAMSMKGNMPMINLMAKESIYGEMGLYMKVNLLRVLGRGMG
jgi:hypothetical protein